MLTGKQRSFLRGLANPLNSTIQIGKEGVSEAFINQLDNMFESSELIKIHVLKNSQLDARNTANLLAKRLHAEFVQAIGNKIVLYKKNKEDPVIELP